MRSLLARNPALEAAALDDIYWGCVQQTLEQGFNIARNAALLAEAPLLSRRLPSIACVVHPCRHCMTQHDEYDRRCAGMSGWRRGAYGPCADESGVDFHPGLSRNVAKAAGMMGLTAEMLARMHSISREMRMPLPRGHTPAPGLTTPSAAFKNEIIPTVVTMPTAS